MKKRSQDATDVIIKNTVNNVLKDSTLHLIRRNVFLLLRIALLNLLTTDKLKELLDVCSVRLASSLSRIDVIHAQRSMRNVQRVKRAASVQNARDSYYQLPMEQHA